MKRLLFTILFVFLVATIASPFCEAKALRDTTEIDLRVVHGGAHGGYDDDIVKNNLANNLPVIVTASDQAIPINGRIHTFVIDGYMMTRTIYTCRFYWVQDAFPPIGEGGENGDMPFPGVLHRPYTDYIYTSPSISQITINWGWGSQWGYPPANEGWYSLTGGCTVHNGGTFDYNHNIKMIYGFHL